MKIAGRRVDRDGEPDAADHIYVDQWPVSTENLIRPFTVTTVVDVPSPLSVMLGTARPVSMMVIDLPLVGLVSTVLMFGKTSEQRPVRLVDAPTVDGDLAYLIYEIVRAAA